MEGLFLSVQGKPLCKHRCGKNKNRDVRGAWPEFVFYILDCSLNKLPRTGNIHVY